MSLLRLVFAELRYRPLSAILTLLVVATSTAAVVFFVGLSELAANRTRVFQRDIGLNLRIIPESTNLDRYWIKGYSEGTIDETLMDRLESQDVANRLVPMLQRTIPWGEGEAILTGIGDERFKRGEELKAVFGGPVQKPESLVLGSTAASLRNLDEGDQVELLGQTFTVERVLATTGSLDDVRVHAGLPVVQQLLELPGRLNEIRALECHCDESIANPMQHLKATLEPLLPGTTIIRQDRLADARRRQRLLAERVGMVASPLLILLAAAGVFGLATLNAYQRRSEIGLLAAVGRSTLTIGMLVWVRSALIGVAGGLLGALFGWVVIVNFGDAFVGKGPGSMEFGLAGLLFGGFVGSAVASLGALIPATLAARSDPAATLRGA